MNNVLCTVDLVGYGGGVRVRVLDPFGRWWQRVMEVEELALLVKGNLYTKHLVLSVEDMFVEFLQAPFSGKAMLELEPMLSYQRMLLHRLADLFGLAHESVGEGDNRHLIIERCQDSSIPPVLVSHVLQNLYGESSQTYSSQQLLRRCSPEPGAQQSFNEQPTTVPLEERQAAYLSARERIFSEFESKSKESLARPRAVPGAARRMITHALGKTSLPDNMKENSKQRNINRDSSSEKLDERMKGSPAKAAQRLFANALGFSVSRHSSLSQSPTCTNKTEEICTTTDGNKKPVTARTARPDMPGAGKTLAKALARDGSRSDLTVNRNIHVT